MYNGFNQKSLNVPTITGLSDIISDTVITNNGVVEDQLIVNGVDIATQLAQISVNTNNITALQQVTTDITYDALTDTTTIDNDLDLNGNNILKVDSLRGETNSTLHIRALGTGDLHLQTSGNTDQLTIDENGVVKILNNHLDMVDNNIIELNSLIGTDNQNVNLRAKGTGELHFQTNGSNNRMEIDENGLIKIVSNDFDLNNNDIINCNNINLSTINGSTLPSLSNIAYTNVANTFTATNTFDTIDMSGNDITNANIIQGKNNTDFEIKALGTGQINFYTNNTIQYYITSSGTNYFTGDAYYQGLFSQTGNSYIDQTGNTTTVGNQFTKSTFLGPVLTDTTQATTLAHLGYLSDFGSGTTHNGISVNTIYNMETMSVNQAGTYLVSYNVRIFNSSGGTRRNIEVYRTSLSTSNATFPAQGSILFTSYNEMRNTSTQVVGLGAGEIDIRSFTSVVYFNSATTFYILCSFAGFGGSDLDIQTRQTSVVRIG